MAQVAPSNPTSNTIAANAVTPTPTAQPASAATAPAATAPGALPAGAIMHGPGTGAATYSMASLYVGDLHEDVTESMLFEKFSMAGPVLSIRVCRDNASRLSLGYAYVNFQQPADAERALDTMNFELMHGKPMRIMWSQRDPTARRAGNGNIFIKNLDKVIDNKSIYDTFSLFGNILSCKVALDDESVSKGYGFVHFETETSALSAIERVNGMLLAGKKVYVGKFQSRAQRLKEFGDGTMKFTNVFVKNFGEHLDEEKLTKLFEKYGEITSVAIMNNKDGKAKGFGFVAFADPDDAAKAVEEMNDSILEGTDLKLAVCRAQKKSERTSELRRKYEALKQERIQRYQGVNLYVKNLDDTMGDEDLKKVFDQFGTITSAKVMTDENGRTRGFGFVCFEKPEEATNAVTEMNTKMVGAKPLYVALAQRKEDRRAQLASQYMQRLATLRMHNNVPGGAVNNVFTPGQGGFYVTNPLPNPAAAAAAARFTEQGSIRGGAASGRNIFPNNQQQFIVQYPFGHPRNSYANNTRQVRNDGRPQYGNTIGGGVPRFNGPRMGQPMQQMQRQGPPQQAHQHQQQHHQQQRAGQKPYYGNQQRPQHQQAPPQQINQHHVQQQQQQHQQQHQQQQVQSGIVISGQEPLTSHMLAQAAPQEQKQLLGERIYALIEKMIPEHKDAGKITGMMLEIDNSELIMMLQDVDLFRSKVDEASAVLNQATQNAQ